MLVFLLQKNRSKNRFFGLFFGLFRISLHSILFHFTFATSKGDKAVSPLLGGSKSATVGKVSRDYSNIHFFFMNIESIIKSSANVQIVVSALELKEAFLNWDAERRDAVQPVQEETYLTMQEAADRLGVVPSTLWRWDKVGYLRKIKVGNSVRYRQSDIIKLMES